MQQHDPAAKVGVWAYLLFTLASFALALYYMLLDGFQYTISTALPMRWATRSLPSSRALPT